jgi:5-methylcytosine-specific restriction endonuclease McrA
LIILRGLSHLQTLVLNAGYEPLLVISWQRAICLVLTNKAEIIEEHDTPVRTVDKEFSMPRVVRLSRYVRLVYRYTQARCSRKHLILRDRSTCQYCGIHCTSKTISIDHIIPRSKGGNSSWENLVVACSSCNHKKANKHLHEAGMSLISTTYAPSWADLVLLEKQYCENKTG